MNQPSSSSFHGHEEEEERTMEDGEERQTAIANYFQQQWHPDPLVPSPPLQGTDGSMEMSADGEDDDNDNTVLPLVAMGLAFESSYFESGASVATTSVAPSLDQEGPRLATSHSFGENLLEARMVDEEDLGMLVDGEHMDESHHKRVCIYIILAIVIAMVILGVTLGVVVTQSKSKKSSSTAQTVAPNWSTTTSTMVPTFEPTTIPNMTEVVMDFRTRLANQTIDTIESNKTSPQYKAYKWVTSDKQAPLVGYDPVKRMTDRFALATLYFATGGGEGGGNSTSLSSWTQRPGWMNYTLHECDWVGIYCRNKPGHDETLWGIDLLTNDLMGTLPLELALLDGLEWFDVRTNRLVGTFPTVLSLLTSLTNLTLSDNDLSGPIPTQVGRLTNLNFLWLEKNSFSGAIPTELGLLTNLVELVMYENALSGSIPSEIGKLRDLKMLDISLTFQSNEQPGLKGTIPTEIWMLSSLQILSLYNNALSGNIATEIGLLTELQMLYLDHNALTGTVPTTLGRLHHFALGELDYNQLNGSMPIEVCKLIPFGLTLVVDCSEVACDCGCDCSHEGSNV